MTYGKGVALVLGAGILWSTIGLVVRQIDEAGAASVMFWRSAGLLPVLWAFLHWRTGGRVLASMRSMGLPGVVGAMGLVAAYAGALYALQATTVANAVFLYSAAPFFAALLGWAALGERVALTTWLAMGLALAGIFVMIGGGIEGGRMDGNIAALISAAGFAVFSVSLRWGHVEDSLPIVLMGGILSMVAAFGLAPMLGQTVSASPHDIAVSMALGAVVLTGGMMLYTYGSKALPTAELTLMSSIENILAPIWVWLLLGETASSATLLGGTMVLIAVMGNAVMGARRQAMA
ncbi:DMT family transporter [Tabrizicola sp.]|uniref:DMT family transporter n=1 Tax=Tabrizicola sp. TaxID=2005166 RepID=UPI003D2BED8A